MALPSMGEGCLGGTLNVPSRRDFALVSALSVELHRVIRVRHPHYLPRFEEHRQGELRLSSMQKCFRFAMIRGTGAMSYQEVLKVSHYQNRPSPLRPLIA